MDHFEYRQGQLYCENVPAARIAEQVGTPAYVYSAATLRDHYERFAEAFRALNPLICFSIKSCQNLALCRLLLERGAGFDVVSGGELYRALRAGADPRKIVYAGVGKTNREIEEALAAGIGWFNVESEAEMENLIRIAAEKRVQTRAALRLNPDVDPQTHRYTTTGKRESKFGVDVERARRFFERFGHSDHVRLRGLHLHIGSPVNRVEPYVEAVRKALALIDELRQAGHAVDMLDLGGGYGAHYRGDEAPPARTYAAELIPLLEGRGLQIVLEPGRSIAANAGILLTTTQYLKASGDKQFVIVDAAMNDLLRPALYEAYHFVWPVQVAAEFTPAHRGPQPQRSGDMLADVVGPVCESGDFIALERRLPPIERGAVLAVFTVGAYGFVMSSQYNSRPRAAEVLVQGGDFRIIRERESYEDLVCGEA
jgi:diaminopimelate decarboxylase